MELLNPWMLWGSLGILIPIALHFWHRKKSRQILWAATRWLSENNMQPSKGFRLDNILLLVLRILMLLLLVLYLAHPLWSFSDLSGETTKIHLVQPEARVMAAYRFELEEALKKGEKVFMLSDDPSEIRTADELKTNGHSSLRNSLASLRRSGKAESAGQWEIYLSNPGAPEDLNQVFVPARVNTHVITDSLLQIPAPVIETQSGTYLALNGEGLLATTGAPADKPVASAVFRTDIRLQDISQKNVLTAALKALEEVYGFSFVTNGNADSKAGYDLIFTDRLPESIHPSSFYFVTGNATGTGFLPNVFFLYDGLSPLSSAMVRAGLLPEWIGEKLLVKLGLKGERTPLSRQQVQQLFKATKYSGHPENDRQVQLILLLFIIIFGLERWMAIRKSA